MELNYRINVIKRDEVVIAKFATRETAKASIKKLKKWFPDTYVCGALEEKIEIEERTEWIVTWICPKICQEKNKTHNYSLYTKPNSLMKRQGRW